MKKLLMLLIVMALASSASAAVNYWHAGGAVGPFDTDWDNTANWTLGAEPVAGDHVILFAQAGGPPSPVVYTPGNIAGNIFTPTWHATTEHVGIKPEGTLMTQGVNDYTQLGVVDGSYGQMSIRGTHDTGTLFMASTDNAKARIHLNAGNQTVPLKTGGELVAGNPDGTGGIGFRYVDTGPVADPTSVVTAQQSYKWAGQNIDLEVGSTLYVSGDKSDSSPTDPAVNWWANGWKTGNPEAGRILTACDGTGTIQAVYNAGTGYTEITAVDGLQGGASTDGSGSIMMWDKKWSADFEDGEVNPGYLPASTYPGTSINTEAYPNPMVGGESSFADSVSAVPQVLPATSIDGYGWTNRGAQVVTGQTVLKKMAATEVDIAGIALDAYTGENAARVESRTLRVDIPLELEEGFYRFTYWYMVPDGEDLTFFNKIVMKDMTNNHMFFTTGNSSLTAPAHNVWFSETWVIDTEGYAPAVAGDTIQFRFGAWLATADGLNNPDWYCYTDNWSLSGIPEPATMILLGLGGLLLRRRK